jgi:molecular chaperone DnaK
VSTFVGIDLGTTYSVVAYINANGQPEVIPNERERSITPSVVYFDGVHPIVGDEAKEQQALGKTEVASFFKRHMGNPEFLFSSYGQDYTPIDLSALVLAHLKAQAEQYLGTTVIDAVVTVPAYFTHTQRTATIEAGRKAGLKVLKIISEPTAAALAYGLRTNQHEQFVLVYDLGGGTFDVSLVSITPTELNVVGTDGDHNLGGKDWDDCLIRYLAQQFEDEYGMELVGDDFNELCVQAEKLKFALSARQSADIRVQAGGHMGTYTVTREQFENLTRNLMERTEVLTERVLVDVIPRRTWSDISGVLPVGGSTRMPMVRTYIERMSGRPPMGGINPDEAVALGAAIQAAMEMEDRQGPNKPTFFLAGRKTTTDVVAHSLGMIAENEDRSRYVNSILIRKNLAIPSSETRPYRMAVRRKGDTELEVFLTQGESDDPQQCAYLGRYVFTDFSLTTEKFAILDITYQYDKNGVVHISAVERATGKPLKLSVEPVPPDVPARFEGRPIDKYAREHLTVYLAFDLSGSMSGRPLAEAQKAAEEFVSQCDLTTTSVGLISFSDRVHVDQGATQNNKEITKAIRNLRIGRTGGGNAGHPFDVIHDRLHNTTGIRYTVVLADGVWAHQETAVRQAQRCHAAGIEIIAVGFGGADRAFLSRIASSSEQSFFTSMNGLTEAFSTIAQELTETGGETRPGGKLRRTF